MMFKKILFSVLLCTNMSVMSMFTCLVKRQQAEEFTKQYRAIVLNELITISKYQKILIHWDVGITTALMGITAYLIRDKINNKRNSEVID